MDPAPPQAPAPRQSPSVPCLSHSTGVPCSHTAPGLSTPRARLRSGTQGPWGHHPPGHGGQREPTATADVPAVPQPHDRERSPSGGGRISSARRCSRSRLSSAGRRSWGGTADVGRSRLRAREHRGRGGPTADPAVPRPALTLGQGAAELQAAGAGSSRGQSSLMSPLVTAGAPSGGF